MKDFQETVRLPLDHPETEALARRIQSLLLLPISDEQRGLLSKKYIELKKADQFLARALHGRKLQHTDFRPLFWNDAGLHAEIILGISKIECASGWVLGLSEFLQSMEAQGSVRPNHLIGAEDDI